MVQIRVLHVPTMVYDTISFLANKGRHVFC
jgi:hypothetical protein